MKLHVIIPVFNVEKYLRQCVESVLNQPFQDLDIVLVDDGSPDSSGAICDELAARDSRISVIHQQNKGLPGARNSGIEYVLSHGAQDEDYIAFLDSDDIWVPGAVTADIFQKHGTIDMIVFSHYRANTDITRLQPVPLNNTNTVLHAGSVSLWTLPVVVWNRFYKVSLLTHTPVRFIESMNFGEDTTFNCGIIYYARSFICLSNYLVCYRMNPHSIMNTVGKKAITPFLSLIDGLLLGLDVFRISDSAYRKSVVNYCCWQFIELFESYYRSLKIDDKPYRILQNHALRDHFAPDLVALSKQEKQRIDLIVNHKTRLKIRFFMQGLSCRLRQGLKQVKPVYKLYEKKAFPLLFQNVT